MAFLQSVRKFSTISTSAMIARDSFPRSSHLVFGGRPSSLSAPHLFSTSSNLEAREWLKQQQYIKLKKTKEQRINLRQKEQEEKYSRFSPGNIALAIVGLAAGSYLGDVMGKRSELDVHDRAGHEESLTAMMRGFGVLGLTFVLEFSSAVNTSGVHFPVVAIGSACLAYVAFRVWSKAFKLAGSGPVVSPDAEGAKGDGSSSSLY